MRLDLYRKLKNRRGFIVLIILVILTALMMLAIAVSALSTRASKAAADDRALVQARYAADTGIERIKAFLKTDPRWSDGSVAVGPVDNTSEIEKVTIEHVVQNGEQITVVTSTGKCRGIRKTVRAVIKTGVVPLISAYGDGIKQLGKTSLKFGGSSTIKSDVLVNSNLFVHGNAVIGLPEEKRTVYVDGDVYVQKAETIRGDIYATGWVHPQAASGQVISNWIPPVEFPSIEELNVLIDFARSIAQAMEKATGKQHYFSTSKTFTVSELEDIEGIYFVEGDAYLQGGVTDARASIVAAGSIYVANSLSAERLVLIAGSDINLKNSSNTSIALAAAGNNAGWGNTGGGSATWTLKYGTLVAGTINGGSVRGNVVLEQNNEVDFSILAAPIHTTRIISHSELE